MSERNRLANGRFRHNLDSWTVSGAVYSAGDGDEHYGVAVLSTGGDYIEQTFTVPVHRIFSLHYALKGIGAQITTGQVTVVISDGDGNTVVTLQPTTTAGDAWEETTDSLGLAPGTTYTIRITNVSATGDVRVDDVWLWFVPATRANMAARVHAKLARLASERSLSTTPSGSLTEGDYTYAVDAGLRQVGAINPETGLPDVRYMDQESVQTVIDAIEKEMLEQLYRDFGVEVDTRMGDVSESLSQRSKVVGDILKGRAGGGSGGRVIVRKLKHKADDFEF